MSLSTINTVVSTILADAAQKIGEALIERAAVVNSMFDDGYGSCLGGHYASGIECAAAGLRQLDDLLEYADEVMPMANAVAWEYVRDALGSVVMDKAPLPENIIAEYNLRIKRYISPTFGDHPRKYIVYEKKTTIESESNVAFVASEHTGNLQSADLYTLGAEYRWNKHLRRWVINALINPNVMPHLAKYMK